MAPTKAASAAAPQMKHYVFISFRGKDTRNNFTSHLRAALERNGIGTFMDKGLKGGEDITTTLADKISQSQVSVVVFSRNYADSHWCLDELVKIMQCKEVNGQMVLPVFLQGVEPSHVRKQTGAFGNAFERLIQDARFADKVENWRCTLKQAADLSGWASDQISESKIVEKLLNRIQSILRQMSSVEIERVDEVDFKGEGGGGWSNGPQVPPDVATVAAQESVRRGDLVNFFNFLFLSFLVFKIL